MTDKPLPKVTLATPEELKALEARRLACQSTPKPTGATMTPDYTHLRELLSKATPGPWDYIVSRTLIHVETPMDALVPAGLHVCSVPKTKEATAELLVEMRNTLPALLDRLEALEKVRAAAEKCRKHMYDHASNTPDNAFEDLANALDSLADARSKP